MSERDRVAHRLKGSSLGIGAEAMARLCAALESCPDDRAQLFASLEKAFSGARAELEAELASRSASA